MNFNFSQKIDKAHLSFISSLCFNPNNPEVLASSCKINILLSKRKNHQALEYK